MIWFVYRKQSQELAEINDTVCRGRICDHRILSFGCKVEICGVFGSVGAMRAVDPARAENVTFIARHFALPPLLFFSDVAGRDNTTN